MRVIKFLLVVVISLLGASFALANAEASVPVRYFVADGQVPLVYLLLASLALGIAVGLLAASGPWLKSGLKARKAEARARRAERELKTLQQMQIGSDA